MADGPSPEEWEAEFGLPAWAGGSTMSPLRPGDQRPYWVCYQPLALMGSGDTPEAAVKDAIGKLHGTGVSRKARKDALASFLKMFAPSEVGQ